jgi:hypothetical protein
MGKLNGLSKERMKERRIRSVKHRHLRASQEISQMAQ